MTTLDTLSPAVLKRLSKELLDLSKDPPEGIKTILNMDNITDVQAWIQGPEGTPYQGGCFRVKLTLGGDFPTAPPKGYFLTKIFHPNVSKTGEICVNVLKKDWKKEYGIGHILLTIKCLLIDPNPESALNEEAGRLLLEDYSAYAKHAKLITSIHGINRSIQFGKLQENCDDTEATKTRRSEKMCENTGPNIKAAAGAAEVLTINNGGTTSPKKRGADKKLEQAKMDKKRTLRRL
ncbi:uncharacterized protein SPPG_01821 [Spizellomyces punctatus DAOM BR117]|uniref:E2 ubiquitin-conjugating enzyme n=1 Tax=Spizellomyces punctatus (strain DAOM BR117) TaxID=645134 RepID=A0A0L0HNV2_SPIPD|nr:uncharacterized protein SPPG_01821 [Spizellomyces punctatus DAOM BR117]KND02738.1 hypothetical protein SPPG_01821 [Spizellomyces punctatus DAOM BR117]|eukprot:XP_016610777.1 hypothetical protein SPPG_01821 [Spizellomyces punctatus DAOM BR117]